MPVKETALAEPRRDGAFHRPDQVGLFRLKGGRGGRGKWRRVSEEQEGQQDDRQPAANGRKRGGRPAQCRNHSRRRRDQSRKRSVHPRCSRHRSGSVPARKVSPSTSGQELPASFPLVASTSAKGTPSGTVKPGEAYAPRA